MVKSPPPATTTRPRYYKKLENATPPPTFLFESPEDLPEFLRRRLSSGKSTSKFSSEAAPSYCHRHGSSGEPAPPPPPTPTPRTPPPEHDEQNPPITHEKKSQNRPHAASSVDFGAVLEGDAPPKNALMSTRYLAPHPSGHGAASSRRSSVQSSDPEGPETDSDDGRVPTILHRGTFSGASLSLCPFETPYLPQRRAKLVYSRYLSAFLSLNTRRTPLPKNHPFFHASRGIPSSNHASNRITSSNHASNRITSSNHASRGISSTNHASRGISSTSHVSRGTNSAANHVSRGHTQQQQPNPVSAFVRSVTRQVPFDASCLLAAIVYIGRIVPRGGGLEINSSNVRRLALVAILLASKVWDDSPVSNPAWAEASGGFSTEEVNAMEAEFLFAIGFDLSVPRKAFDELHGLALEYSGEE